jgi:hypothetical protein
MNPGMSLRRDPNRGNVDGGEGSGVPLGGHDDRPPTGYRNVDDDTVDAAIDDMDDAEALWDDSDPADRRRDPLRKP